MSGLLIRNYPTLATTFNSDDYSDLDGATGGTRKMLLSVMATRFGVQLSADGMVFGAGSVSAPLLAVGTAGNGIYASATNTLDVATNGAMAITVTSGQFVGIGVATPVSALHVGTSLTTSPRGVMSAQYSTGTDGARFHMRKARGTATAPTTIVTGDVLGKLVATGYDGSNYLEMASISLEATGTVAATRVPTRIVFSTATNAAPSVLTDRMWLSSAGNLGVGTSSETGLTGSGGMIVASTTLGTSGASGALIVGGTGAFGKKCFITDGSTGAQLRLEYTAASVYSDLGTLSTGHLDITNTAGSRITSTIVNNTAVSARARQGGLAFDGVTNAKDLHTIGANIGTSDFSVAMTILVPSANPSANLGLAGISSSATTTGVDGGFNIYIGTDGSLNVFTRAATGATSLYGTLTGFISSYGGRVVTIIFARNATTPSMTCYVNGIAQTLTQSGGASPTTWAQSINSTYVFWGQSNASEYFNSTIYSAQLFTRALSASEVVDLANKGVAEADKWASLTALYTSSFTGGTDSWAANGGGSITLTSNATDPASVTGTLKVENTSGGSVRMDLAKTVSSLTAGKRYRITAYIYNGNIAGNPYFVFNVGGTTSSATSASSNQIAAGASGTVTVDVTATGNTSLRLGTATSATGDNSTSQAAGAVYYVKSIVLTEVGCLLDADLGFGVGYQAPDRSSNSYHGVVSATGTAWTLAQRRGQLLVTSNTNGNQQLLGSQVCLPTNAIITSIIGYTTGTPTIKIGNVSAGSQLVASVAMSASTYQSFTLAATTTTTGNLWVNSSTSDTIYWTVNYMIATP